MKNLLILILPLFFSCNVVNKLFKKDKHVRDSTSIVHERKDSVATNDNISVHKDSSSADYETVIDFGDSKMVIPYKPTVRDSGIYYWPTNQEDYFSFDTKTGVIKSSKIPVSVRIKSSQSGFNYDSLVNHSKIEESEAKDTETKVSEKKKTVTRDTKKTKMWWWLLLLIPVYLIYRNWPKIKAIAIHLITGL